MTNSPEAAPGRGREAALGRAQGCLLGQLAGDALGSLVEFQTPDRIRRAYPGGVRELADGGTWDTLAGQPTDDSEMALALARTLVGRAAYDGRAALGAYRAWMDSRPFDIGSTVSAGLGGRPNADSQANGALMRLSPLGIFGAGRDLAQVADWARQDALLTHPHRVCVQCNMLMAMALAHTIDAGCSPRDVYDDIAGRARAMSADPPVLDAIARAATEPPDDYVRQQGWVLIAFQNALWQLLHADSLEEGVVDTVMRGGDTDTTGAIVGALLGAVYGRQAVPAQWIERLLNCRPQAGQPGVRRPRPREYWPVDALELAEQLMQR
jgi:ADP-ribosyl-[dinitrogen reductase] hydrolase